MTTKTKCPTCGLGYIRGHNAIHDCTGYLLEKLAVAEAALKPFAERHEPRRYEVKDSTSDEAEWTEYLDMSKLPEYIIRGDFRRAHEAYQKIKGLGNGS